VKKKKIYLDTSVISYLDQQDVPVEMQQTRELWEIFKTGKYDIVISGVVIAEIRKCSAEKLAILMNYLNQIEYEQYDPGVEALTVANEIIREGILSQAHFNDCHHIASAILTNCDIILSWNFRHLVRAKTIDGIHRLLSRIFPDVHLAICAPSALMGARR
jgi:predicted nucleic acid-binding protein